MKEYLIILKTYAEMKSVRNNSLKR